MKSSTFDPASCPMHLLFGVLRIFGTLMAWNRRQSHDCSELFWLPRFPSRGRLAARTDTWHCPFSRDWKWRRQILWIQCTLHIGLFQWRVNRYIYRHILIICYLNVRQNQRVKTLQKHTYRCTKNSNLNICLISEEKVYSNTGNTCSFENQIKSSRKEKNPIRTYAFSVHIIEWDEVKTGCRLV
jgi:hypothetical protein